MAALRKGRTQVGVRTPVFRVERNSFPEFADRTGEVAPLHERYTEPVVRLRRSRSNLDRMLEGLEGEREIILLEINPAQPDQKLGVAGIAFELAFDFTGRRSARWVCRRGACELRSRFDRAKQNYIRRKQPTKTHEGPPHSTSTRSERGRN